MADTFGLIVRFELVPEHAEEFDALVTDTTLQVSKLEPDTLIYTCHRTNNPYERVFYELYRSESAFEAHGAQPHTQAFLRERERLITGFEVDFLTPYIHAGSLFRDE